MTETWLRNGRPLAPLLSVWVVTACLLFRGLDVGSRAEPALLLAVGVVALVPATAAAFFWGIVFGASAPRATEAETGAAEPSPPGDAAPGREQD